MKYLKNDYGDLIITVNSSDIETNFSKLKDPVAFLDRKTKKLKK